MKDWHTHLDVMRNKKLKIRTRESSLDDFAEYKMKKLSINFLKVQKKNKINNYFLSLSSRCR